MPTPVSLMSGLVDLGVFQLGKYPGLVVLDSGDIPVLKLQGPGHHGHLPARNVLGVRAAHAVIRQHVAHLDIDRPMYVDHNIMKDLVRSGAILDAVEKAVGPLE